MNSPFKRWPALVVAVALGAVAVMAACSSDPTTVYVTADAATSCGDGSQLCGSTCTPVARDPENCGKCGTKCAAGEVCSAGACAASCGGGTTKCGQSCVDTKADGANCGACGTKCNGGEVCSAGKCAPTCAASATQCGNSCVNAQVDPTNCGACGTICNAGEACTAGKCQISCQAGLTLCAKSQSDGGVSDASSDAANDATSDGGLGTTYCANLQSDSANCGACGTTCSGNGYACSTGQCLPGSCFAIKQSNPAAVNGTFTIDPDGSGPLPAVQAYCDMTSGGQTLFRTVHNWGEWGAGMNIVVRDTTVPTVGSVAEWDASCTAFGKTKYVGSWKNNGGTYSQSNFTVYADSKDYWDNNLHALFPNVTYNQVLILQDSVTPACWAWYAETGSLQSLGSPAGGGFAFCRNGNTASERYHIYLCLP